MGNSGVILNFMLASVGFKNMTVEMLMFKHSEWGLASTSTLLLPGKHGGPFLRLVGGLPDDTLEDETKHVPKIDRDKHR